MDLVRIDRDIEAAARADPLAIDWEDYRHVSGQRALGELESQGGALAGALATWVSWLTAARVSQPALRTRDEARGREQTTVRLLKDTRMTEPEIIRALLVARSASEASALRDAWPDVASRLRSTEQRLGETRKEAFHRLGIDDVAARFLGVPRAELCTLAERFLGQTSDLARASVRSEWPLALDVRLARAAVDGWPAHLTWRTLSELVPGLSLRGPGGSKLPESPRALGGASFARALIALGRAFRRTCDAESAPFAMREPPLFVDGHRTAFVFAAITQEPAFHVRSLGLMPGRAKDQARVLRLALFVHARTLALRVALARSDADYEALTALDFGVPLPPEMRGAWPRIDEDAMAQLVAVATLLPRLDALREREGDDWFRNPKAFLTLRDITLSPAAVEKLDVTPLVRRFEEQLG